MKEHTSNERVVKVVGIDLAKRGGQRRGWTTGTFSRLAAQRA